MSARIKSVALAGCVAALVFQWRVTAQDDSLGRNAQAILAESCYGCHGPGQQMGGLRLDTDARKAITPGHACRQPLDQASHRRFGGFGAHADGRACSIRR